MSRYSAQKQFWKAKQAKHEKDKIGDVVLLQKLQVTREHSRRKVLNRSHVAVWEVLMVFSVGGKDKLAAYFLHTSVRPLVSSLCAD